ncbi:MAG: hypothetical protein JOZ27_07660, partial [Caulobacteraceae bacterium]|nr:hypothetical protein [Caulobacteraceae bacterium]
MEPLDQEAEVVALLAQAKVLAVRYYELTGKPLGVAGEVAEFEAARLLGIRLSAARTPLLDGERLVNGAVQRLQIKGRAVSRTNLYRGRVGGIKIGEGYDIVLLVLLDRTSFNAIEIWEATREDVIDRIQAPGS